MKKILAFMAAMFLMLIYSVTVFSQESGDKLQFSLNGGIQNNNFNWSIAGNSDGQNPNIYSELKWRDIKSSSYFAALEWNFYKRFLISGTYTYSAVTSGQVNDIDYQSDNRSNPVYNQTFNSNKGNTALLNTGLGYQVIKNKNLVFTTFLGYIKNKQLLYLIGNTASGMLNSSYTANWNGAYLKINALVTIIKKFKIIADLTYSQVNYNSQANWNLINEFAHPVSFRQKAFGYGIEADTKLVYQLTRHLGCYIGGSYFNWQTGKGIDQLYLSSGESTKTQLHQAVNTGNRLFAGLNLSF